MKNGEWMVKNGYNFRELTCKWCGKTGNYDYYILLNDKCVGKVKKSYSNEAITTWLDMEYQEPILTNSEREYIAAVIKPFRNDVIYVRKTNFPDPKGDGFQRISIMLTGVNEDIILPLFKSDTMYKGMEEDKMYTPEELRL